MRLNQKYLLVLITALAFSFGGCTSKKAAEEDSGVDVAEVSGEGDGLESTDDVASTDSSADLGSGELSLDEQLPEEKSEVATPAEELAGSPESLEEPAKTDIASNEEPALEPASEPTPEPMSEAPPTTVDDSLASGGMESSSPAPMTEEEPKKSAPLRKIADMPYEQGGVLINAVYLARKGDTVDTVVSRIYGSSDRKKELLKLNPTLKARGVKVGDKIYYNSPQRPTDNQKLLTYFEDMGLAPETYAVAQPENIREIAKKLLGDANSWKELWSTNMDLESKGDLPEGTQLRYWAGTGSMLAQAEPPPAPQEMAPPPVDPVAAAPMEQAPPPPPPMETQQPPDMNAMAQTNDVGMQAPEPPPPPPPVEAAPPPPPPGDEMASGETAEGDDLMGVLGNPDQTMALGAGAILLLGAVAIFIMIRKRNKARQQIDFHTSTQTQID